MWFSGRRRWLFVVPLLVLAVAGGVSWAVFFRTVGSPVGLSAALRLYRNEGSRQTGESGGTRPFSVGVYSYQTSGNESLSLPGVAREFPERTEMIAQDGVPGCSTDDWVPLVQHTEGMAICQGPDHSLIIDDFTAYEQISGTTTSTRIDCPQTAYLIPASPTSGKRWRAACRQRRPAGAVRLLGKVVGGEAIQVGTQSVRTMHVRVVLTFDGGTSQSDLWLSTSHGLVVREEETAKFAELGVNYQERMSASLVSLRPAV